ncbi:MAG: GntR family transcriptional regulator [Alphaproteobacteria bacterium]|nr:GntR family transcriptional regulator [Alphaproteobacteria bacterium]
MSVTQPTETIARRSLHDELVDRVRELIVDGSLSAGSKVPERELCERFGVSRTPMREALKVLAAEGLVLLEPNRGAWVTRVTIEELEEVFPVMGALEALSGELACERISEAGIAAIEDTHRRMVTHFQAGQLAEYFRANQEIHEAILTAADNATLSAQYKSLASRVRRARYIANMSRERWTKAVAEHEQILAALRTRDGQALARVLKQHLANKFDTVREWLQSQR